MDSLTPILSVCSNCSPAATVVDGGNEPARCLKCGCTFFLPRTSIIPPCDAATASLELAEIESVRSTDGKWQAIFATLSSLLLNGVALFVLAIFCFEFETAESFKIDALFTEGAEAPFAVLPELNAGGNDSETKNRDLAAEVAVISDGDSGASKGEALLPEAIGGMGPGNGSSGFGIGMFDGIEAANTFAYVVDASGSMEGERMQRVKGELQKSILSLQEHQRFFVVFFNKRTFPMMWPRSELQLVSAHELNTTRVLKWANSIQPEESTLSQTALRMALRLQPDILFFLTDGDVPRDSVRTAKLHCGKTRIHTICVGDDVDTKPLQEIANVSGGQLRIAR